MFKFKQQITGRTGNGDTKDVEIMVQLKYLYNFWKTFKMSLPNFQINLQLERNEKCIVVAVTAEDQVPEFKITIF